MDKVMMAECLRLAGQGRGRVGLNPLVGAVLVKNRRVLARGYHRRFGGAHAEIECLRRAGKKAEGATLYVNLEPCAHHGKTPPCVDAIRRGKVARVVVGMRDPNPHVSGGGIRKLRSAGINVTAGVLRGEAEHLNRSFTKHITRGYPYIHLKIAQTIDGKIAERNRPGRWFTTGESREKVHRWRAECDAVLVGAGTIRSDDPLLTTRAVHGRNPALIVLDGRLTSPVDARAFAGRHRRSVFICADRAYAKQSAGKVVRFEKKGVKVLTFAGRGGKVDLLQMLRALYKQGIGSVLVEGGAEVFRTFAEKMLFDELSIFVAPWFNGAGVPAFGEDGPWMKRGKGKIRWHSAEKVGTDLLLKAYVV